MPGGRVVKLEGSPSDCIRVLSDRIELGEAQKRSVETLTRVFKYDSDPLYGKLEITADMLDQMVRNFAAGVYGQKVYVNLAHNDAAGAAGEIVRVFRDGKKLRAEVDWHPLGREAVLDKGFRYFSAEFVENYADPESGKKHGAVLLGAALTIRPRVKRLDPINPEALELAESADGRRYSVTPNFRILLSQEITTMWEQLIKKLKDTLSAKKLADALITALAASFEAAVKGVTEEAQANVLLAAYTGLGDSLAKQLAEHGGAVTLALDPQAIAAAVAGAVPPGGKALSEADITRLLDARDSARAETQKRLADALAANQKLFDDALGAAESVKALSDSVRAPLLAARELITADMSADQVQRLAGHQVSLAGTLSAAAKLHAMGYAPAGSPRISVDDSNRVKALQEAVDRRLGILDRPDGQRYERTGGKLQEANKRLAEKVLADFDARHGAQLHAEAKLLAAGDGLVSDVAVPAVFERTVIREALYQLVALQFVDAGSIEFGSSYTIPYSYRDTAAAGRDSTRKYEGQSIARAGVIQTSETAYATPQKLAFEVSDELRYLTAAGILNWDAVAENQRNASRIIGEDLDRLLLNEVVNASDEYGAVAVSNENLELQADGTKKIFVLANFPVVRPRKVYNLQGTQVGSTSNPVTVSYNSVALSEYDGTGTQAAGTYYVLDYNLGEIYLVNQAGAIQTPADATAYTISYAYGTNVYNFNTDVGSSTAKDHWDTFLYRYGLRKAVIESDRYHMANFGLMRGAVMNQIEQAGKFAANFRVPGTDLAADGSLGRIKAVPNFEAFGTLNIADNRVLLGERGITRLRMAKPWSLGQMENQKDANGRFTGKKEAYGDQFVVIHTPTQLKRAYTSLNLYSATARVARAA